MLRTSSPIRVSRLVGVVVVALASTGMPRAVAQVTTDDLEQAAAAREAAEERLGAALADLDAAMEMEVRLAATLASITARQDEVGDAALAEAGAVKDRLSRMYMAAGRPDVLLATVSDVAGFFTRLAYLGAVAERDLEEVNRFALVVADLTALLAEARGRLGDVAAQVAALEVVVASQTAERDQAAAHLAEVRQRWAEQEAARRAAIEAETRRQEEALARQAAAAAATSTTVAATTTTTQASSGFSTDDGGHTYDPARGVEQWRPLVSAIFARWGLDRQKCGPDGCLGPHIDDALTIMWCESRGVPFAVNPSSGTTGLFQHRPVFWAERVARTRSHPESAGYLPGDATPYNPAHNIEVAALLIWESRETLIGNMSLSGPWDDGPQPFGHWDGTSRYCADPPLVWP